jgi:hypothetical protein
MQSRSNAVSIFVGFVATLAFGAVTYFSVEAAGGTGVRSDYSNTPNAVTQGPPGVK